MPLYEYKCGQCQQLFELIQKFSDEPLTVHDGCGGAVERVISAPALQFKGSGWYITDYARSGSGNKPPGKNGGESDASKSSDSKSGESKSGESKSGESKASPSDSGSKSSSSTSSSSSSSGSGGSGSSSSDAKK